jgi:23S rRNA (guanine1835-N2)-methyltransferase
MRAMSRLHTFPETMLAHARGAVTVRRWPRQRSETLRAWDGADLYLLDLPDTAAAGPALVLNDTCGALALLLPGCVVSGDSWLARAALLANAADNGLTFDEQRWCWPDQPWPAQPARVLVRVPKQLALLEYQLWRLATELPAGTPVALAWMDKHLPGNLLALVRRYLGDIDLLRGQYKAHGLTGRITGAAVPAPPYPGSVAVPGFDWELTVRAGVFAQDQLDVGARFFMQHVPSGVSGRIADLGCGNGVIGLVAAARNPAAQVVFCDESWQALESARENAARYAGSADTAFHLGNGLAGCDGQFDLVLLNPPFHRGHAVDDSMARMLFRQVARRLAPQGELRVIGNRHLGYAGLLKRYFRQVVRIADSDKFSIVSAVGVVER